MARRRYGRFIRTKEKFVIMETYSGFALPIPPLDEVNPQTFTPPPGSNVPAEKPQLSIGIPSLSTDPSVPMIRSTFINMVEQDLVSPTK